MTKRLQKLIGLAAILVPLFASVDYGREFMSVDSCLDRDGSYDYVLQVCDFQNNHTSSPYFRRHATLFYTLGIGEILLLILFAIVLLQVRKTAPNRQLGAD